MHTVTNNKGSRLNHARNKLGLNQKDIALLFGLKGNVGISKRESNRVDLTFEEANILQSNYGISANWLLTGEGDMFTNMVVEAPGVYKTKGPDTTDEAIHKRFVTETELQGKQQELLSREIADCLGISDSHWSQVKSGQKKITFGMFADAVLNLNVDANFVLAKVDSKLYELKALQAENEQLKKDKQNLEQLVAMMRLEREQSAEQKKSA